MKIKILAVFLIITIIFNFTIVSYARDTIDYINPDDLAVIEKIYNDNSEILDWDITTPLSIKNTQWDIFNDKYCLTELDLSNTEIKGKVELSDCNHIENYSFFNTNINEIILPNCLNYIPQSAFEGCSALEYINISESINSIQSRAFKNCSNLKSVILNNNNTAISSEAFSGCISLECIANANNITAIGRNAFTNCSSLVFYDDGEFNSYIKKYAINMNYPISSTTQSSISGYIAVMTSSKEEKSRNDPYRAGTAYLYDENNALIEEQKLDTEGKFFFNNLSVGHKYKIIIDGQFAIARSKYIIVSKNDNYISDKESPLHVVTCDYDKDGYITSSDALTIFRMSGNRNEEEIASYDLNGDSYVTAADAGTVYALAGFSNYE